MPSAFVVLKSLSNVATYMEMYVVATVSLSCANHPHVAPSEGLSQLMGASPSFSGGASKCRRTSAKCTDSVSDVQFDLAIFHLVSP